MRDLNGTPVFRQMLDLAAVSLIGMTAQTLFSIVDLYFVGRLGASAQAAVSVSGSLSMVVMAISQMLSVGTASLVSQAVGRRHPHEAQSAFDQAMSFSILLSALFLVLITYCGARFGQIFGADAHTAALGATYLQWIGPAMALQLPMTAMGASLRGSGNIRPFVLTQSLSVLLNAALAPVLILGWLGFPALGVAGAGLATFIAVSSCFIGLCFYLTRAHVALRLRPAQWKPRFAAWRRLAGIGLPAAGEALLTFAYMVLVMYLLRPFGAAEQAGFGAGQRLITMFLLPAMAICVAVGPMIGQSYGARLGGRIQDIFSTALKLSFWSGLFLVVTCYLFAHPLMLLFSPDPAVQNAGVHYLQILSLNLLPISVALVCFGVLAGVGNTVPTLIGAAARAGVLVVATSWLSTRPGFSPTTIWTWSVVAAVVQMVINVWLVRRQLQKAMVKFSAET